MHTHTHTATYIYKNNNRSTTVKRIKKCFEQLLSLVFFSAIFRHKVFLLHQKISLTRDLSLYFIAELNSITDFLATLWTLVMLKYAVFPYLSISRDFQLCVYVHSQQPCNCFRSCGHMLKMMN